MELPQGCVKLQLWDTAGQEKYKALVRIYYRGAAAAIVTFDVSSKVSLSDSRGSRADPSRFHWNFLTGPPFSPGIIHLRADMGVGSATGGPYDGDCTSGEQE